LRPTGEQKRLNVYLSKWGKNSKSAAEWAQFPQLTFAEQATLFAEQLLPKMVRRQLFYWGQ
jgi:hypothetical protein